MTKQEGKPKLKGNLFTCTKSNALLYQRLGLTYASNLLQLLPVLLPYVVIIVFAIRQYAA